jgi:hypothetical protein
LRLHNEILFELKNVSQITDLVFVFDQVVGKKSDVDKRSIRNCRPNRFVGVIVEALHRRVIAHTEEIFQNSINKKLKMKFFLIYTI